MPIRHLLSHPFATARFNLNESFALFTHIICASFLFHLHHVSISNSSPICLLECENRTINFKFESRKVITTKNDNTNKTYFSIIEFAFQMKICAHESIKLFIYDMKRNAFRANDVTLYYIKLVSIVCMIYGYCQTIFMLKNDNCCKNMCANNI